MKQAQKENTIREVLSLSDGIAAIFAGHGMFCIGCPSAQDETVEEACALHGIDADEIMKDINAFLADKK